MDKLNQIKELVEEVASDFLIPLSEEPKRQFAKQILNIINEPNEQIAKESCIGMKLFEVGKLIDNFQLGMLTRYEAISLIMKEIGPYMNTTPRTTIHNGIIIIEFGEDDSNV